MKIRFLLQGAAALLIGLIIGGVAAFLVSILFQCSQYACSDATWQVWAIIGSLVAALVSGVITLPLGIALLVKIRGHRPRSALITGASLSLLLGILTLPGSWLGSYRRFIPLIESIDYN
jgi:hypothetical protein